MKLGRRWQVLKVGSLGTMPGFKDVAFFNHTSLSVLNGYSCSLFPFLNVEAVYSLEPFAPDLFFYIRTSLNIGISGEPKITNLTFLTYFLERGANPLNLLH